MILSPLDKRRSIGLTEAARVLGIPSRTLRRHAAEGAVPGAFRIGTGGSGIGRVFASTVGAGAYSGYSAGRSAAVGAAASAMGWAVPGPSSGAATHSMGARPNYARRPMNTLPPPPAGLA